MIEHDVEGRPMSFIPGLMLSFGWNAPSYHIEALSAVALGERLTVQRSKGIPT